TRALAQVFRVVASRRILLQIQGLGRLSARLFWDSCPAMTKVCPAGSRLPSAAAIKHTPATTTTRNHRATWGGDGPQTHPHEPGWAGPGRVAAGGRRPRRRPEART